MEKDKKGNSEPTAVDFHEAAVIDEHGNEIEITEEMVRKAINTLDKDAYPESSASSK